MKDIKLSSASFIKKEHLFKKFNGWQDGYGAFTYHHSSKNNLIDTSGSDLGVLKTLKGLNTNLY